MMWQSHVVASGWVVIVAVVPVCDVRTIHSLPCGLLWALYLVQDAQHLLRDLLPLRLFCGLRVKGVQLLLECRDAVSLL